VKVLIVVCDLQVGGAEQVTLQLVRALAGRGFAFTIAAIKPGGVLAEGFARSGAEVFDGVARRRLDPLAPVRIARIIRRRDIEAVVIVDVTRNAMFYGLTGAALSRRKLLRICWCHSPLGGTAGWFTGRLRRYRAFCSLDAVVCTTRLEKRLLADSGLGRRHTFVIHNGIDLAQFAGPPPCKVPLPEGKKVIVQVANFMPHKDYPTLVAAAGKLAETRDDFHLLLAGRGTDCPQMQEAIAGARLAGRATLLGCRDDIPAILGAADIFVLATRYEAFSVATLEAMASHLPIIVSDTPAFDEMFTHGREGLKAPPGDADALAAAMARLLDDSELRSRLAAAAARRAQRFSLPRMAEAFARLLRAGGRGKQPLLNSRRPVPRAGFGR